MRRAGGVAHLAGGIARRERVDSAVKSAREESALRRSHLGRTHRVTPRLSRGDPRLGDTMRRERTPRDDDEDEPDVSLRDRMTRLDGELVEARPHLRLQALALRVAGVDPIKACDELRVIG